MKYWKQHSSHDSKIRRRQFRWSGKWWELSGSEAAKEGHRGWGHLLYIGCGNFVKRGWGNFVKRGWGQLLYIGWGNISSSVTYNKTVGQESALNL